VVLVTEFYVRHSREEKSMTAQRLTLAGWLAITNAVL